ncbi:MAG: hypothetical protein J6S26_00545 [Solobacterium sp.]|nr:hypothetical protein [Solobacterium sp.]
MAAWIEKHRHLFYLLSAAVLTVLFCIPYLAKDFLAVEHDTFFHLSRIEGLAESISRGVWFPKIYPYKNGGFGYGSPMFYCDLLLVPSALLYLSGISLCAVYRILILVLTFFTALSMMYLAEEISGKPGVSVLVSAAFLFSNYRITNVYVRGALGEVTGLLFLTVLLKGLYDLFERKKSGAWKTIFFGLAGLVFSHNLTFLFGVVLVIVFALFCFRRDSNMASPLFRAAGCAFLVSAWFTLPMIEQLSAQNLILNYYASSSDLAGSALPLWKYFVNETVFGYGSNDLPRNLQMTLNPGIFLSLIPLSVFYLWIRKHDVPRFVKVSLVLGYLFLILPWDGIPWDHLSVLSILQFPWRLLTPSIVLLSIGAAYGLGQLPERWKYLVPLLFLAVSLEGVYHVLPAMERTFGITSETAYEAFLDGSLIDPYYSASYVRTELAGGEYLPSGSVDFRVFEYALHDRSGNVLPASMVKDGTSLTVSLSDLPEDGMIEVPLTWYPGYACEAEDGTPLAVASSSRHLAEAVLPSGGTYRIFYRGTALQHLSAWISLLSLPLVFWMLLRMRKPV